MTTNAHTPTPWEVGDLDHNGQRIVRGEHIEICTCWHHCVGSIEREMEANATLIVKAVNSHDDLVAALRNAKWLCDNINEFGQCTDSEGFDAADMAIRAALAKLEAA